MKPTPEAVLATWESIVGATLSGSHRREFLSRREVADICAHDQHDVLTAARTSFRAGGGVLLLAQWHDELLRMHRPEPAPPSQGRLPRSGRRPEGTPAGPPTRGHSGGGQVTRYGSGLVRAPGAPEAMLPGRETCAACGRVVRADGQCGCS